MRLKLNPVMMGLLAAQAVFIPLPVAWAAVLDSYNPTANDGKVGSLNITDGASQSLTGIQQFDPGLVGTQPTVLGDLLNSSRITSGAALIGAARLDPGPQNFGITIPDPTTGGNTTFQVYNPGSLVDQAPVTAATSVPDVVNVGDRQYIDARVSDVTAGALEVNIGQAGASITSANNSWTMAAKQTTLFNAESTSTADPASINWTSQNRITFTGVAADPTVPRQFQVTNVATYNGAFSVTTLDGNSRAFNVTNAASLKSYNDWLITELKAGNLATSSYLTEFNKAFSKSNQNIAYAITADDPLDDVAQAVGDRVVLNATGAGATITVAPTARLEVAGANGGAIRASNGATVVNNGKVASQGSLGSDSAALSLNSSTGTNNGVINGGFFNRVDGTGVGSTGYNSNGVNVAGTGTFSNNPGGIVNFATTGNPAGGYTAAINLTDSATADNSGIINVGVNGSSASGTTSGVAVGATSQFTNNAQGTIYIGRGPQNSASDSVADTAMNQSGTTSGISVSAGGTATNDGNIVIGSKVQNAAGMLATGGNSTRMVNNGTISVNGAASTVPRENIGMSIVNAGLGGNINNAGTLNLNGINSTGVKVVATNGNQASANSTGTINVAGGADPASGTRNFGIWVEGQGSGTSTANVDGAINLTGTGAIGVHARGNATVNVDSAAIPSFSQGSNQIAFFAYGPNAKINVVGNNAFDVTTTGSTLFRLEQGADFDGTNLALTASGANSVGVLGTGTGGTQISTQNADINVSGTGATGVIVEGGATGTIDAATNINLSGANAVGAIADGQKHDLSGKNSGPAQTATTLVSNAALGSTQSGLTGLIARNRAQLTNTGDINFSGAGTTGISVESGATASNSGNISVNNGGTGIRVVGGTPQATTANNTGTLNVNGGSTTSRTRGVSATGSNAIANLNGAIAMNGLGAIGAETLNGARVNLNAASTPVFNNTDQIAYHAAGAGSAINSATSTNTVSTDRSTLYRIDDAAALNFTSPAAITLSGADSTGVIASGSGSQFNSGSSQFIANGDGATAVSVEGGANGTLASGSTLTLNGANSVGVRVNNLRTDLSNALNGTSAATAVTSQASVTGSGQNAIGYDVANGGTLVNQGNVTLNGANNIGIRTRSGSNITNQGVVNVAQGTGLDISGSGTTLARGGEINVADGIAGVRVGSGSSLALTGSDTVITTNGTAHGILLDSGAAALTASDATLNVNGSGNGIENRVETGNVTLNNLTVNVANGSGLRTAVPFDAGSRVTTNVSGSGIGLNFTQADGAATDNDLILGDGYQFNVSGAGGTGIRANTTGNVQSAANVNITSSNGGSALVAGTARSVLNTGTLTSASTTAPVVDLRGGTAVFENLGTITTTSPLGQAVAGSDANDVVLLTEGDVVGDVSTGGGTDSLRWTGGTLNGSLTLGGGVNNSALIDGVDLSQTRHITNGGATGGALTFNNIDARGGSFASDDLSKGVNLGSGWSTINFTGSRWELTDDLQLAHSTIAIAADSILYAGNGVNPTLAGGSNNSLTVNNAGIIDLTNGSGSPGNALSIDGNLASDNGQVKLNTDLNEGGVLSNQFTDNLRVEGNASGTTLLDVTPSVLSNGNLTDLNHSSTVEGYEGISLAQVAGSARADSFALKGGYLAAGPWSYVLYSFAPGSSDANQRRVGDGNTNQFWDYRLANKYVCEGGIACQPGANVAAVATTPNGAGLSNPPADNCVKDGIDTCAPGRPAVVPQVPAYISAPLGLAYYTTAIIDDLHKRLGELRHQQSQPEGYGGEMFLRYIGSNMTYKTNQSFKAFGYDFDEDYSAVQVGGNLLKFDGEKDSLRGGIAYTRGNTRLRPDAADGYSSTTFDSDSVALYGTWQRDNGFYLDGVLSYDWHRGETDIARQKTVAKLKGQGWTASLESGYPFELGNGVRLEPQAQLMYLHLDMDNFTDKDNLTVKYNDYNQTIGRLGARLDRTWTDDSERQYTPYVRGNVYKGWGGQSKTTLGQQGYDNFDHTFTGGQFGQMWELGVGGTTTFKNDVSLYAEADYRKEIDGNGAKGWRYNAGVRWTF